MTIDFHLLGETDERLVSTAKELAYDLRCGNTADTARLLVTLDDLVERCYLLHEAVEQRDREAANADNLSTLLDDLRGTVRDVAADLAPFVTTEGVERDVTDTAYRITNAIADLRDAL